MNADRSADALLANAGVCTTRSSLKTPDIFGRSLCRLFSFSRCREGDGSRTDCPSRNVVPTIITRAVDDARKTVEYAVLFRYH